MRLRPVFGDPALIAEAASQALGTVLRPVAELDLDVVRLHPVAGATDMVVRAFGPSVQPESLDAVVGVLTRLAPTAFPAERCVTATPLVPLDRGRHLLLTEYVEPAPEPRPGFLLAWCAALLGQLATRHGDDLPPGGGWHRLGQTPDEELDAALQLAASLGPAASPLLDALSEADDASGLPTALVHPDLVPANTIPRGDAPPIVVDWLGVGTGPRAWPLAVLLTAGGPRAALRTIERWSRSAELTDEERERLPDIMLTRPLALDIWSVAHQRMPLERAIARVPHHRADIARIASALDLRRPHR